MNGHNSHFLQVTRCAPQGSILVLCTERKYRPIYNEIYSFSSERWGHQSIKFETEHIIQFFHDSGSLQTDWVPIYPTKKKIKQLKILKIR